MKLKQQKTKLRKFINSDYTCYVARGLVYGYPRCCIIAFITKENFSELIVFGKLNTSGFRPCEDCAREVRNGRKKLKDLIQDYRFPEYGKFVENWTSLKKLGIKEKD